MTAESSTYTYEGGEQETVILRRGPATPHGHALLRIDHGGGEDLDCYVDTAWLRDRLNDLGETRRIDTCPDKDAHWRLDEALGAIERLTRERDEALEGARVAFARCRELEKARREAVDELYRLRATDPRPLTPDAITATFAAMVAKILGDRGHGWVPSHYLRESMRAAAAALTEPPARPKGAEEIEAYMREIVVSHPEDHYGELADHLASRGVLPPITDKTNPEKEQS